MTLSRRKRAHDDTVSSHASPSPSETVQHQSSSSNIRQTPFPLSILTQSARSYSYLTEPTSPAHEIHPELETSFIDLKLCVPTNKKSFTHPLAPASSFSRSLSSSTTTIPIGGSRTVFSRSQIEQYSLAKKLATSQLGDFMDISASKKLMKDTSRARIKVLAKREKVWREGGLRNENEIDLDGSIQMRKSMIEWIWKVSRRQILRGCTEGCTGRFEERQF